MLKLCLALAVLSASGCKEYMDKQADQFEADIHQKVIADSVAQYEIAVRSGDKMDACMHAGLVAAAHMQAQDEAGFAKWKAIEKKACKRAGL